MKILVTLVAILSSAFAHADCSKSKSSNVTPQCRQELLRALQGDTLSHAVSTALETNYPLRSCRMGAAKDLRIKFEKDEAAGPRLEVTALVSCESDSESDGYQLSGEFFLDGGGYRFKQITLSTFE